MGAGSPSIIPYCGAAPAPDTLWERWNIDPVLLAALAILACLYALGAVRLRRRNNPASGREKRAFYSGWAVATVALISPLCPLSVSLFAARVGQHMILALIAAPLVAAGRPSICLAALWPSPVRPERSPHARATAAPLTAAGLFAALLWFWHAPAPYAATFASALAYWSMHVSLFGSALFLWRNLLDQAPSRMMRTVAAGAVSSLQMGFLGALITLASRPLYAPHALTTAAWGLTPLQDQQLGGAIMWVPGCLIFLAVAIVVPWLAMRRAASHPIEMVLS